VELARYDLAVPISFPVSDVPLATAAPSLTSWSDALVGRGAHGAIASSGPAELLVGPNIHPLVLAAHVAFAEHRPLSLAPDDIWSCVLQGVAEHVRRNPERLRDRFVSFAGTADIEIQRDDLAPLADPPGDWSTVPGELCDQVVARSGDRARALRRSFSTTDRVASVAMDVALLDAMSSYFRYSVATMCGIPSITLLGTPDDWVGLLRSVDALDGLDLDDWLGPLRNVLAELRRAAEGHPDREFFRRLYKPESFSGGDLVVGWIHVLFPYLRESKGERPRSFDVQVRADAFPLGVSRVPFTWRLFSEQRAMELVAGHVGVSWDSTSGAVRPRFGHWVAPASAERRFVVHTPGPNAILTPHDGKTLRALDGIGDEAAPFEGATLQLTWCPMLESLGGIESARALASVSLMECPRLGSLAPLAQLPIRNLHVAQCAGLEDVEAIRTLHSLETLALMRCPRVSKLPPIAELPRLRQVSLWGFDALPERFRKQLTTPEEIRALQAFVREAG